MNQNTKETYEFIKRYIAKHGYGPSYEEIRQGIGVKSKSTVLYHVQLLIHDGLVEAAPEGARARTLRIRE